MKTKSSSAFRTISEVAKELDLPQHVLRFWETKFTQIHPMKSGGKRRYYRPEDVETIKTIRNLLHNEGFTIKGAQKFLRSGAANPEIVEVVTQNNSNALQEFKIMLSELKEIKTLVHSAKV